VEFWIETGDSGLVARNLPHILVFSSLTHLTQQPTNQGALLCAFWRLSMSTNGWLAFHRTLRKLAANNRLTDSRNTPSRVPGSDVRRWMQAGSAVLLGVVSIFALSGCSVLRLTLGMRVNLAKIPVASIEVIQSKDPGIGPGKTSRLIVKVTQTDGKVLQTEGAGKGKVTWKDLTVTPTLVTANNKGVIALPHDPRKSEGKLAHVAIAVPSHPGLHADLDIPLRYDYNFVSNFSGSPGYGGMSGTSGMDGTSGSMGSIDPDNPSPGGDGGNGSNGSDGSNGGPGGDAPPVQALVTLRTGIHPLLQASVSAAGHTRYYLVDPQGGTLTVKADGGRGGSGGSGGKGGSGGSGGAGSPAGSSGSSGSDGMDGSAGADGNGGLITLTYDPQVKPYLALIHLSNWRGPQPILQEAPVAPLW